MDTLFECYVPDTRKYAKTMARFRQFSYPKSKTMLIILSVMLGAFLISSIIMLIFEGSFGNLIMAAVFIAFLTILHLVIYRVTVNSTIKQMKELSGDNEPEARYVFTNEKMIMYHSNGGVSDVELASFKRVYVQKDAIYAESSAKLLYFLPKESFVKGSPEELVKFLSSKGIRVS